MAASCGYDDGPPAQGVTAFCGLSQIGSFLASLHAVGYHVDSLDASAAQHCFC